MKSAFYFLFFKIFYYPTGRKYDIVLWFCREMAVSHKVASDPFFYPHIQKQVHKIFPGVILDFLDVTEYLTASLYDHYFIDRQKCDNLE